MNLLFGNDEDVARWVGERIKSVGRDGFGPCSAIGVVSDRLIAGLVFHDYQPDFENVQLSMAAESPMWAGHDVIAGLLDYPFNQLGCWMIYTLTPPENERALKVNEHIGLKRKTVTPHAFGRKRHAVVCQMTRPEYERRYKHG